MIATDLETLDALIETAIVGITPRRTRQNDKGWIPYQKKRKGAHFSRAFRLDWNPLEFTDAGIFTQNAVETTAELDVVTDYKDTEEDISFVVEDDKHQLRDVLNDLMAPDNGLLWFEELGTETDEDDDLGGTVILHRFTVRYLRARA